MDYFLDNFIASNSNKFSSENEVSLNEGLRELEDAIKAPQFSDHNQKQLYSSLWTSLLKHSVKIRNIGLAFLVINKLELSPLTSLVRSIFELDRENSSIALSYIAKHFHLDEEFEIYKAPRLNNHKDHSSASYENLVELYINCDNWDRALALEIGRFQDEQGHRQIIFHHLAKQHEINEDFNLALINYEKSETHREHSCRVILKQFVDSANDQLKKYCSTEVSLQNFWAEYSLFCGNYQEALAVYSSNEDTSASVRCYLLQGDIESAQKIAFDTVSDKVCDFVEAPFQLKWFDKQQLDNITLIGSRLNSNTRKGLAKLAAKYLQDNLISKACGLYLCLEQPSIVLNLVPQFLDKPSSLEVISLLGLRHICAKQLIEFISHYDSNHRRRGRKIRLKEDQTLFTLCIKLGLIDEALQIFSSIALELDLRCIDQAVNHLEQAIDDRHSGSLEYIDPQLTNSTLNVIQGFSNNQVLSTQVLTVVILSTTIFVFKIDMGDISDSTIFNLEVIFKKISEYLKSFNFIASDPLISATSSLTRAIKDKLDVLSDSNVIREGFKQLVETAADRCMVEGRYKSAAMLYSHIEDNVSAIKSLMRMGDVDIVINYSLLVRDITVNRITINYLKHLGTSQAVIEDFITRSKL